MSNKRLPITKEIRQQVYDKYDGCCAYCGEEFKDIKDMQVDHLHPVYLGGTNDIDNLMPSCRMCNFYKSTYTLEKFREQLGLLLGRLDKQFIYRLAKKYQLVEEHKDKVPVKFYFEWLKEIGD